MKQTLRAYLLRALRGRCPRCGKDSLYSGWNHLKSDCTSCLAAFASRGPDCWFFIYMSTAFLTGVIIIAMLLVRPENIWLGRAAVAIVSFFVIFLTLPLRKAIAIAIDIYLEDKLQ